MRPIILHTSDAEGRPSGPFYVNPERITSWSKHSVIIGDTEYVGFLETPEEIAALVAKATEDSDVAFLREKLAEMRRAEKERDDARAKIESIWRTWKRDSAQQTGRMIEEAYNMLAKSGALGG